MLRLGALGRVRGLCVALAFAFAVHVAFTQFTLAQNRDSQPCKSTVVGTVENFGLPSKVFDYTRTVWVFLPPGYAEPSNRERKYPVLYMFDGQNLFDACLAFDHVHEWQVDETVTRLVGEGKIEPLIVVGLENARQKRAYEYLPWPDSLQDPGAPPPAGQRLPEFLIKEVMPAIEGKYRVAKGREKTGIGGSSYGGVAALYAGVSAPTIFGKVLAESPILLVGNGELVRHTSFLLMAPMKVFMAFGGQEWDMPGGTEAQVKMIRAVEANLKNALLSPSEVLYVYDADSKHNEEAWAKRLPQALTFLFPAPK
jgi:predicted alpha/beta superfamily hydrolase